MRKILLLIAITLLLAVTGLYLLLPRQVSLSQTAAIGAPPGAVLRSMTHPDKWRQWWGAEDSLLRYREQNFAADQRLSNTFIVDIAAGDTLVPGLLMAIGVSRDSTLVSWEATLPAGANPLHRIRTWLQGRKLKREMASLLARLELFARDPQKVYGLPVKEVKVTTPYLVAARGNSTGYPTTGDVYAQVNKLRTYIRSQGAHETAPPMLNVTAPDNARYSFMVALPTDRLLPGRGDIEQKRMVLGNILKAEVRGGDSTVQRGLAALEDYMRDYGYRSPAIPYASLTTDRTKEQDTAQWITHLYYPVF